MPRVYTCPYWSWARTKWESCDGAWLRFPSEHSREAYIARYCAHAKGWQKCTFAQELTRYHEDLEVRCGGLAS
ncbi:hypothetical protein FACS1894217_07800 [Clostridia bacterium]|nr:hypothetical protein FACS1894217_07800 [Clostridia bacterium]